MAHILVIDDEESMQKLLRLLLEADGHAISTASDGGQALRRFDDSVQLVITDVLMPGVGGLQTIDSLRKRAPSVPIITMTGGGEIAPGEYLDVAQSIGADRLLPKPFTPSALRETVAALLPQDARDSASATSSTGETETRPELITTMDVSHWPMEMLLSAIRDAISSTQVESHGRQPRKDPHPEWTRSVATAIIYWYVHGVCGSEEILEACRREGAIRDFEITGAINQAMLAKFRRRHRTLIQQSVRKLYWFLCVKHASQPWSACGERTTGTVSRPRRVDQNLDVKIEEQSEDHLFRAAFMDRMLSEG